jgi:hypothetical protein
VTHSRLAPVGWLSLFPLRRLPTAIATFCNPNAEACTLYPWLRPGLFGSLMWFGTWPIREARRRWLRRAVKNMGAALERGAQ